MANKCVNLKIIEFNLTALNRVQMRASTKHSQKASKILIVHHKYIEKIQVGTDRKDDENVIFNLSPREYSTPLLTANLGSCLPLRSSNLPSLLPLDTAGFHLVPVLFHPLSVSGPGIRQHEGLCRSASFAFGLVRSALNFVSDI